MGSNLNTFHLVSAPPAVPYRFGLFSVATPRTPDLGAAGVDEHWRLGITWQSQVCSEAFSTTGACIDPDVTPLTPDGLCSVHEFDPFTVYAYDDDAIVGRSLDEHEQDARDRLLKGEQLAAEQHLWGSMATTLGLNSVDLTGSPLYVALGAVEQLVAQSYGAMGVVHMSRAAAIALCDHIYADGQTMRTKLGTPIVVGGGYDEVDPGAYPSTASIFGTGPLVLYRGDVDTRQMAIDKSRNQVSFVAQRDYVIGWDCSVVGAVGSLCNVCTPSVA